MASNEKDETMTGGGEARLKCPVTAERKKCELNKSLSFQVH